MLVRELSQTACKKVLSRARVARIACARDGQPYVVPVGVVFDGSDLYSFSTLGQKIEWMRENPLVCVEVDEIEDAGNWTTVVVFGRFEELTRSPAHRRARAHAEEVLGHHDNFWYPAAARTSTREPTTPVFFRVIIESMTGRQTGK
jgi:nitroimidazol reductase NimA-like FMN-containing flavoprotein (pyridoxamine 5'-phosphate oxidase superfamily)